MDQYYNSILLIIIIFINKKNVDYLLEVARAQMLKTRDEY
jgi:hypothetical protein